MPVIATTWTSAILTWWTAKVETYNYPENAMKIQLGLSFGARSLLITSPEFCYTLEHIAVFALPILEIYC